MKQYFPAPAIKEEKADVSGTYNPRLFTIDRTEDEGSIAFVSNARADHNNDSLTSEERPEFISQKVR